MNRPPSSLARLTPVSEERPLAERKGPLSALARLSLGGASVAMLTGCLIDDPPPYIEPQRTPPRLVYQSASPPLDYVIVASQNKSLKFTIQVASEDAGEPLRTQFWVDDRLENYDGLPASTLDDTERSVVFSYTVPRNIISGCHRFKIRVGHESNLPQGSGKPRDPDDVAEAYWLAYLNLPADQSGVPLEDCPTYMPGGQP